MTREFTNKFPGVKCYVCGKEIAIGAPLKWSKRGSIRRKWHVNCAGTGLDGNEETTKTEALKEDASYTNGYRNISDNSDDAKKALEAYKQDFGLGTDGDTDWKEFNKANGYSNTEALKERFAKTLEGGATTLEDTLGLGTKTAKSTETVNATNGHSNGTPAGDWLSGFAGAMAPYLEEKLKAKPDRAEIAEIVKGIVEGALKGAVLLTATTVKLEDVKTGEIKDLGLQHKEFPTLLENTDARLDTWLTGPAGSGKTTACRKIANALGLEFFHVGAMDNEYKLKGFIDAQGRVVNTQFKKWYLEGGVICLDEVDSWLPSATLALNAALDNGHCDFPDGMLERHPDAIAIACANTYGLGDGNTDYVGRMKQDAAFVDRFVQLYWDYDEALETAMVPNTAWVKRVQYLRARARAKGLKVIISPRASIKGAKLLARGKLTQEQIERQTIRKGMTLEQWNSIQ